MALRLVSGMDCRACVPARVACEHPSILRPHAANRGRGAVLARATDGQAPGPEPPSEEQPSGQQPQRPRQQPAQQRQPAQRRQRRRRIGIGGQKSTEKLTLDDFNPIAMGRRSREIFDDVWTQLQRIGSPTRSIFVDDEYMAFDTPEEFESPAAPSTTVLVTGATGRVGRVLVRKLLLRGYNVKALVRQRSAPGEDAIPQRVEQVVGDITKYEDCRKAVEGVDKIICCSAARSTNTADLTRVDDRGVSNVARALMDRWNQQARKNGQVPSRSKVTVADFSRAEYYRRWDMEHVGVPTGSEEAAAGGRPPRRRSAKARELPRDVAEAYINTENNLVFEGQLRSRGAYAEVGSAVSDLPHGSTLAGTEGVLVRLAGDGNQYSLVARTVSGLSYSARLPTSAGYGEARLPYHTFVPQSAGIPALDPADIAHITLRFDQPRKQQVGTVVEAGEAEETQTTDFHLEVDWIKALPGGIEADFILVSCAGRRADMDELAQERVQKAKLAGEAALRSSGLGYVIVRPGPLLEEAGGYRALVFDQSRRITKGIACADVADVCLKALHDPLGRNKTFEVCWEYTAEAGLEAYELVAHLPDKANNYLSPALATLQKNT